MTAPLIAWQPPEGCDVLAPTVGGGRAPCLDYIEGRWQSPGSRQSWPLTQRPALLLQHAGQSVRAGMDAGRAVLAGAVVLDPTEGVALRRYAIDDLPNTEWAIDSYADDDHRMIGIDGSVPAPRALVLSLVEHIGGRAIITDNTGEEVEHDH